MAQPGDPRNTRAWRTLKAAVLAGSDRCGLCGRVKCVRGCHDVADEADHIIPVSVDPSLALEPTNVRPAHGCCNRQRGDSEMEVDTWTREW